MKNGWKRWIRGWSLIVILLSVLSVSGCSVSEEDGLQEVTEKVSQEPEVSQKDSGKSEDQEKPGQTEGDTDTGSKKSAEKKIWVYVCGAVNAPGVYELKEDARLYEAIELAGGVNQEAAPEVYWQTESGFMFQSRMRQSLILCRIRGWKVTREQRIPGER